MLGKSQVIVCIDADRHEARRIRVVQVFVCVYMCVYMCVKAHSLLLIFVSSSPPLCTTHTHTHRIAVVFTITAGVSTYLLW